MANTFIVATGVCVVCSVCVSTVAVSLRDAQKLNKTLDRNKNILAAAGVLQERETVKQLLQRRIAEGVLREEAGLDALFDYEIEEKWLSLETGELFEKNDLPPEYWDERKAAKDPKLRVSIAPERDSNPGFKYKAPYHPIYFSKGRGEDRRIILPVHGKGLWSTLYGFLALDAEDLTTVRSFAFYEHGETPGLGGEVDNKRWKDSWKGKKAFDDQWQLRISLAKRTARKGAVHEVDGLSGATLTANGVKRLVRFWLGEEGYGPYLRKLREGRRHG